MRIPILTLVVLLAASSLAIGAERKKQKQSNPDLPNAKVEIYKTVGDVKLPVYIHTPENHKASDKRAAVVFFFGGGWKSGSPEQFRHHCEHFAKRGMVAIAADYRVASRHNVKAFQCVEDAKSAIRWVRANAKRLGIDPDKIVASGGSAGGHLAAATALVPGFDAVTDDKSISAIPNALALFNPALVLSPLKGAEKETGHYELSLERAGVNAEKISPAHHIRAGAPPTIIFHGRADTTVPFDGIEVFAKRMKEAKNRCELVAYEGQGHGFFNHRKGQKFFKETLSEMDEFLVSLGYIAPVKKEIAERKNHK